MLKYQGLGMAENRKAMNSDVIPVDDIMLRYQIYFNYHVPVLTYRRYAKYGNGSQLIVEITIEATIIQGKYP